MSEDQTSNSMYQRSLRYLQGNSTSPSSFDLSKFLKFELQRGEEDSAIPEMLNFNVSSVGVENDQLSFLIGFENPNYVSIGSKQDLLTIEIVNPTFFSSEG